MQKRRHVLMRYVDRIRQALIQTGVKWRARTIGGPLRNLHSLLDGLEPLLEAKTFFGLLASRGQDTAEQRCSGSSGPSALVLRRMSLSGGVDGDRLYVAQRANGAVRQARAEGRRVDGVVELAEDRVRPQGLPAPLRGRGAGLGARAVVALLLEDRAAGQKGGHPSIRKVEDTLGDDFFKFLQGRGVVHQEQHQVQASAQMNALRWRCRVYLLAGCCRDGALAGVVDLALLPGTTLALDLQTEALRQRATKRLC
mmetsp:Transcript_104114/g.333858  ORF Transcript_104114/g.333858 Transcript_104114/m.333858 type:complete len:254 (-) Transcript_104114:363-1124(-)